MTQVISRAISARELFLISVLPLSEVLAKQNTDNVEIDRGRIEYAILVSQTSDSVEMHKAIDDYVQVIKAAGDKLLRSGF